MRGTIAKLNAEIFIASKKNKKLVVRRLHRCGKYIIKYICIYIVFYHNTFRERESKVILKISCNIYPSL